MDLRWSKLHVFLSFQAATLWQVARWQIWSLHQKNPLPRMPRPAQKSHCPEDSAHFCTRRGKPTKSVLFSKQSPILYENVWNMQVRVQKRGWTYSWIDAPCPLCIYPPAQPRHIDLHATFDFGKDCRTNEVTLLVGILGPWHIHGISMIHGEFISRLPSYSHHTPMFLNRNGIKALEWWRSITTHRSKVDMIHAMLHVHYISIGGYWRSNRNETITDGILSGWDTESAWNIKKYGIHHYNPLQVHHLGMIMDGLSIN